MVGAGKGGRSWYPVHGRSAGWEGESNQMSITGCFAALRLGEELCQVIGVK